MGAGQPGVGGTEPVSRDRLRSEAQPEAPQGEQGRRHLHRGIGRDQYPTPGGVFYIKELLRPPDPTGAYGPYAYGLSGFSNVKELANFEGGQGTIGIHGTNDPSSIGSSVSHGCVRMRNEDITKLAQVLPLGTPVEIQQ